MKEKKCLKGEGSEKVKKRKTAKSHPDCMYCGCGGDGVHICGVCKLSGIDGPVIRGTEGTLFPEGVY